MNGSRIALGRLAASCALALCVASPVAFAQVTPPADTQTPAQAPAAPTFERADGNKDGFVDQTEARAVPGLASAFSDADANRDGKLDRSEFGKAASKIGSGK